MNGAHCPKIVSKKITRFGTLTSRSSNPSRFNDPKSRIHRLLEVLCMLSSDNYRGEHNASSMISLILNVDVLDSLKSTYPPKLLPFRADPTGSQTSIYTASPKCL